MNRTKKIFDCITVGELIQRLNDYVKDDSSKLNNNVMIVDDWYPPKYYNVNTALGSIFEREVKPAVVEMRKEKVKEEQLTFGNYHWENNEGKICAPGQGHIVSNGPVYKEVEKEIPCQKSPPEYKSEDVFLIVTDLFKEEK